MFVVEVRRVCSCRHSEVVGTICVHMFPSANPASVCQLIEGCGSNVLYLQRDENKSATVSFFTLPTPHSLSKEKKSQGKKKEKKEKREIGKNREAKRSPKQ